jgi:hypothetical protein
VCFEASQDTGRFIGTPFVARDMISIVDALGQGPKLNYWGVSYGTILGQIAASMFPERIGRMILDSNLRADDYATTMWMSSLRDSERALANLFDDCVKVGSEMCSLADYHGKNTTGESLLRTFDEKFESLIRKSHDETNATKKEVILSGAVGFKSFILNELYSASDYPSVVSRVEGLFTGNDTAMFAPSEQEISSKWNPTGANAVYGISCSDSTFRAEDPDDLFSIYQAHLAEGSFSEVVTPSRFTCARWKFSAAEQIDVSKLRNVKTSFPILIINGKYDPVTSLSGAWETSARFRGSRLLVHEGVGVSSSLHIYVPVFLTEPPSTDYSTTRRTAPRMQSPGTSLMERCPSSTPPVVPTCLLSNMLTSRPRRRSRTQLNILNERKC